MAREVSWVSLDIHYLDDLLCVGPPSSNLCGILLATIHVAERFGIPLASDKMEGPISTISSLGIVISSVAMECCLPEDKLLALQAEIAGG